MFIFMQRIHMKINQYLINKREEVRLDHFNDTKPLKNIRMTCEMSIKILKITV